MKKSLSLLVAIAMVFSMFATVVSAADETTTPGQYLNELGVILGNQDGDLKEDQTWKRQDVAVLLSRLLGVEDEAKDADKTHEFTDVTDANYDGYISWAVEEGLFEGKGDGKFGFGAELKAQELYALILRVFGEDTTGENYADVPELAVEYGFATEDTDFTAVPKRGETYQVIVAALKTEVEPGVTLEQKLGLVEVTELTASATASGAKKITVTFNQAVDQTKATIAVKNNNVTVNVKEATWAEDKKSVVLEFGNALAAADYTVTVTGLSEEALTSTVKVEAEKVDKIEFQSANAPLKRGENDEVTLGYVVKNQYGENITSSTALTATSSKGGAVAANGVVTVTVAAPGFFNINETIHVSLLHINGTYVSTTATVSAEARVAAIEVSKLYQQDGKTLEVGGTAADTFKLVLGLKDQYGNKITDIANLNDDIITTVTNTAVASVAGYNPSTNSATFGNTTIDGSNEVTLALDDTVAAGTSTVTFISKTTGAKASFDVVVKDSVKVDVLTLSAPASAPAGSTVEIPFTAVDQFGNAIANPTNAQINSASITGGGDVNFVKDVVKNTTALKVELPATKGTAIVTILTGTNKVAQLTINVTDASVASVISGTKDLTTAVLKGATVTLGKGNIVVKDQYNNDKSITYSAEAGEVNGQYRVVATSSNSNATISEDGEVYDDQAVVITGATKGSATITLKLQKNTAANDATPVWADVANSSFSFTFKVVEKADIVSYEGAISGPLYAGTVAVPVTADYAKDVTVKGVLADGSKVSIPNHVDNYTVSVNTTGLSYDDGTGKVIASTAVALTDGKAEAPVLVLVKAATTTELLTLTANISNATPAVDTLTVKTVAPVTKVDDNTISVATATSVNDQTKLEAVIAAAVVAKDQYGVELDEDYSAVVATNFDGAENLAGLGAGDSFTVTAITTNNKTIKIKVIVEA